MDIDEGLFIRRQALSSRWFQFQNEGLNVNELAYLSWETVICFLPICWCGLWMSSYRLEQQDTAIILHSCSEKRGEKKRCGHCHTQSVFISHILASLSSKWHLGKRHCHRDKVKEQSRLLFCPAAQFWPPRLNLHRFPFVVFAIVQPFVSPLCLGWPLATKQQTRAQRKAFGGGGDRGCLLTAYSVRKSTHID